MVTKYHVAYLRKLGVSKLLTAIPLTMDAFPHTLPKKWSKTGTSSPLWRGSRWLGIPFCLFDTTPEIPGDVRE
jgi:hypothetical protein